MAGLPEPVDVAPLTPVSAYACHARLHPCACVIACVTRRLANTFAASLEMRSEFVEPDMPPAPHAFVPPTALFDGSLAKLSSFEAVLAASRLPDDVAAGLAAHIPDVSPYLAPTHVYATSTVLRDVVDIVHMALNAYELHYVRTGPSLVRARYLHCLCRSRHVACRADNGSDIQAKRPLSVKRTGVQTQQAS